MQLQTEEGGKEAFYELKAALVSSTAVAYCLQIWQTFCHMAHGVVVCGELNKVKKNGSA